MYILTFAVIITSFCVIHINNSLLHFYIYKKTPLYLYKSVYKWLRADANALKV